MDTNSTAKDITMKELVLRIGKWIIFLGLRWKILLLAALVGGGIGFSYASFSRHKYVAKLSFVVEESKGGMLGAYSGLASQLGIDIGGAGGSESGVFSGDNIILFLQSRLLVSRTLLTDTVWNGNEITLGDLYLETYGLKEKWKDKPLLSAFSFPLHGRSENLSRLQDSVMNLLYFAITTKNLTADKVDKKYSFIDVTTTTDNEIFSKLFTERLVNEAIDFYVKTRTKQSQLSVNRLQFEADSILDQLNKKTYAAAQSQDLNQNAARKIATLGAEFAARDKVVLGTMYSEVVKNLELAKMSLAQETPIIQIIDSPVWPLKEEKIEKAFALVVGFLLGLFFCSAFLIVSFMFKESMK